MGTGPWNICLTEKSTVESWTPGCRNARHSGRPGLVPELTPWPRHPGHPPSRDLQGVPLRKLRKVPHNLYLDDLTIRLRINDEVTHIFHLKLRHHCTRELI